MSASKVSRVLHNAQSGQNKVKCRLRTIFRSIQSEPSSIRCPHIVIVTAEPYPHRIASLAPGTGDIDCVYHFALSELQAAASEKNNPAILDMLDILISGKRLRDISNLPFDLAI